MMVDPCHSLLTFLINSVQGRRCTRRSTQIFSSSWRWTSDSQNNNGEKRTTSHVLGLTISPWTDWSRSTRAPRWPYKFTNWLWTRIPVNTLLTVKMQDSSLKLRIILPEDFQWKSISTHCVTKCISHWPMTQAELPSQLSWLAVYGRDEQWPISYDSDTITVGVAQKAQNDSVVFRVPNRSWSVGC